MRRILLLALLIAVAPARAEAPSPEAPKSEAPKPEATGAADLRPVQKFGADHPDCVAWTDGCMICTPKVCSTPGIACTPHEPICEAQAAKSESPKPGEAKPDAPKPDVPPVAPPSQKP